MTLKFARFGSLGAEEPVVVVDDANGRTRHFSLLPLTQDIDSAFLSRDFVAETQLALDAGRLPAVGPSARIGAPVARPGAVVGIGLNYAAHAAESGLEPPASPVVFLKPANTVAGPYDEFPGLPGSEQLDWEVELGLVIGRHAHLLADEHEAQAAVAGYVLANDLSERSLQLGGAGGQWTKGKSLPGSTPLGPWLVPAVGADGTPFDVSSLPLATRVNGVECQRSTTADMVFRAAFLVHHVSQFMALEPGDVIITGTPEGVAMSGRFEYLKHGDVVEIEAPGLGAQRVVVG
ncbi:fumarylacetoacetate hydrolase family protein [Arthrobacter woluwensis]|uniref:fumarylacetoacetate hydrolase family protein n=1 Tax=Arthrobacter woluwensis TaxID=156980 RepID=UPI0011A1308D|nr:fumarylacetoacetate hydrolase family protein [Arthrobacter woluwensis]